MPRKHTAKPGNRACRACGARIYVSEHGEWAVKIADQKPAMKFRVGWVCNEACRKEAEKKIEAAMKFYTKNPAPRKKEW